MKISEAISVAINGIKSDAMDDTEAKGLIARTIYQELIREKTIEQITPDKDMLDDVLGMIGMTITIGDSRIVGKIRMPHPQGGYQ